LTVQASEIMTLFGYNYWANARILDAAAKLRAAQFTAVAGTSYSSLRGTLVHTYGVEWLYRVRCQEGLAPDHLPPITDFPTFESLRDRWQAEEQAMRAYVGSLSDQDLSRVVAYKTTSGVPHENVLWELLLQVVLHGAQDRSEAAMALTRFRQSPGDIDFILFLRERSA
jgi:uncharacterized damage-inducible protein DinB